MNRKEALKFYKIGRSLPQGSTESQCFFDLSIEADDTFSYAYFEKSVPFNKRGNYVKGFELLNKAVELNPKMHLGYKGWLRLVKLKDYHGCIGDLTELKNIKSRSFNIKAWGNNVDYLIGLSHLGLKEYTKAIYYFNLTIREDKEEINLNHQLYKAIALYMKEELEQSIQILNTCINHNHNFIEAYYYLGVIYFKKRNKYKATTNFNICLSLYKKGFKARNPYNEVFMELYFENISQYLEKLNFKID